MHISHFLELTFSFTEQACLLNPKGIILAINPAATEFIGKQNNEVEGDHFSSILDTTETRFEQYLKLSTSSREATVGKLLILNSNIESIC